MCYLRDGARDDAPSSARSRLLGRNAAADAEFRALSTKVEILSTAQILATLHDRMRRPLHSGRVHFREIDTRFEQAPREFWPWKCLDKQAIGRENFKPRCTSNSFPHRSKQLVPNPGLGNKPKPSKS